MAQSLDNLGWFYRGKMEQQQWVASDNKFMNTFLAGLTLLGGYFFIMFLYSLIRLNLSLFILPGKSLRSFGQPSKTWALITGASDGIGKEYAFHLAKAGYSTLLVSRTASKLDLVAQEIKSKYNTPTRTFTIDFGANRTEDYDKLKSVIDGLDIAILINNVGASHSMPLLFVETPMQEIEQIIKINCLATLRVTQLVAAGMIQRKRGLILTMGSFGGLIPTPLLATYSGSKAFLQQWSTALGSELAPYGITVELVQSYLVTTAMSKIRKASAFVPTPRQYVKAVLNKVGRTVGAQGWTYSSTPYWSHAILQWTVNCFLGPHNTLLLAYNLWLHKGIKARALKKKAGKGNGKSEIPKVE
ncbi:MAG: hypothetical protein Q9217_006185 [Psora testacea]